jgi:hypothetical protein
MARCHRWPTANRANQPTLTTMEDLKAILALIVLILIILTGIWMDNHLPGFNPVETRQHP